MALWAVPTCKKPVGDGAILALIGILTICVEYIKKMVMGKYEVLLIANEQKRKARVKRGPKSRLLAEEDLVAVIPPEREAKRTGTEVPTDAEQADVHEPEVPVLAEGEKQIGPAVGE